MKTMDRENKNKNYRGGSRVVANFDVRTHIFHGLEIGSAHYNLL